MTKRELNEVLSLHKQWLVSNGEKGKRAYLWYTDLRNLDFNGADMQDANMQGADMQGAIMRGANMQGVDMQGANTRGADMQGADMQGAELDYSVWPLWCGSFDVKCDVRLAAQLAYHFCRLDCEDKEVIAAQNALIKLANKFHLVKMCGVLKTKRIRKTTTKQTKRRMR